MNSVTGVSLPRSGHHMLTNILQCYFGEKFRYCPGYYNTDCCHSSPCERGVTYSKTHDFVLGVDVNPRARYLVQTRNFADALASDFQMAVRIGAVADTSEMFVEFAKMRLRYYQSFHDKWVAPGEHTTIHYEELVRNPVYEAGRAIKVFDPGHLPNPSLLKSICAMLSVGPRPEPISFRYVEALRHLTAGRPS